MSTVTRSTKSNEPATVDFRHTCDKVKSIGNSSAVDFVAELLPVLATVESVASVHQALQR